MLIASANLFYVKFITVILLQDSSIKIHLLNLNKTNLMQMQNKDWHPTPKDFIIVALIGLGMGILGLSMIVALFLC